MDNDNQGSTSTQEPSRQGRRRGKPKKSRWVVKGSTPAAVPNQPSAEQKGTEVPASANGQASSKRLQRRRRNRKKKTNQADASAGTDNPAGASAPNNNNSNNNSRRRNRRKNQKSKQESKQRNDDAGSQRRDAAASGPATATAKKPRRRRQRKAYPRPDQDPSNGDLAQAPLKRQSSKENTELAKGLSERLKKGKYECSICYDRIGVRARTWSCERCFCVLHLSCVQTWARSKSDTRSNVEASVWLCPGCLHENKEPPTEYLCFCGATPDPEFNPYLVPHSCGNVCNKPRGHQCPHACSLLCHPGHCPPCSVLGPKKSCPCGRTSYHLRCGEEEKSRRTCEAVCGKALSCGNHTCERTCHNGPCGDCKQTEVQKCFCGATEKERPCGSGSALQGDDEKRAFGCGQKCEKKRDCGNHTCGRQCHQGACLPCVRIPQDPQPCACGAIKLGYQMSSSPLVHRKSCKDPLPTCKNVCGRMLACGMHTCTETCHDSKCPPCKEPVEVSCRCGQATKVMTCSEIQAKRADLKSQETKEDDEHAVEAAIFTCNRKCRRQLSCRQHRCNTVCCPASQQDIPRAHLCRRTCNKPLDCGTHNCVSPCHLGYCDPCRVIFRNGISCACGRTTIRRAVKCGTAPPTCKHPCRKQRDCNHPCRLKCHPGPCPPCVVLVDKVCGGGHTTVHNIPCHIQQPSCGAKCGKLRECGQHLCEHRCHGGPCRLKDSARIAHVDEKSDDEEVGLRACGQSCGIVRRVCGHACAERCHVGRDCPSDKPCDVWVKIFCQCRRKSKRIKCALTASGTSPNEINGKSTLECDDQCEIELRNKRLKDAFKSVYGDLPSNSSSSGSKPYLPFPRILLEHVADSIPMSFLQKVERTISKFALKQREKQTLVFPAMPEHQRWLLHQLAPYYNLKAESYDQGKNRFVRYVRQLKVIIPAVLLSEAVSLFVKDPDAVRTIEGDRILEFFDLTPGLHPSDLHQLLSPWTGRYRLNWIDNTHAVAVFDTSALMEDAKSKVDLQNLFSLTEQAVEDEEAKAAAWRKAKTATDADGWQVQSSRRKSKRAQLKGPAAVEVSSSSFAPLQDAWDDDVEEPAKTTRSSWADEEDDAGVQAEEEEQEEEKDDSGPGDKVNPFDVLNDPNE